MSARIFSDDVLFLQRLLKTEGLYQGDLDGDWGPLTEKALTTFEQRGEEIRSKVREFDSRSESSIRTLALRAQTEARRCLARIQGAGIDARIISGTRTYAEQDRLYRQGRYGNTGPIVTRARGARSNHNFGIAWDIGIFTPGNGYVTDDEPYDEAATAGISSALEWGGHWADFVDKPHYQLRTGLQLAQVRAHFEAGEPLLSFA